MIWEKLQAQEIKVFSESFAIIRAETPTTFHQNFSTKIKERKKLKICKKDHIIGSNAESLILSSCYSVSKFDEKGSK